MTSGVSASKDGTKTALDLADQAALGSTRAAYDLAQILKPESVSELVEFIDPPDPVGAFDAIADGFFLSTYVQRNKGGHP